MLFRIREAAQTYDQCARIGTGEAIMAQGHVCSVGEVESTKVNKRQHRNRGTSYVLGTCFEVYQDEENRHCRRGVDRDL